jgi:hypothetical protein
VNNVRAIVGLLGVLCVSSAQAQTYAYSVNADGNAAGSAGASGDELYRIKLETGEAQRIGPVGAEDVEGLAFDSDGVLYGVDDTRKTTLTINLGSGRGTPVGGLVGNTRLAASIDNAQDPSLAFTCSRELLGMTLRAKTLFRVNTANGVFEARGGAGASAGKITDMAVIGSTVYGLGETSLYQIDGITGITTAIGGYGGTVNFADGGGLAADGTGKLWAVAERFASNGDVGPSEIYRIDARTGLANLVSMSIPGLQSLAINENTCSAPLQSASVAVPSLNIVGALVMLLGIFGLSRKFAQ